MTIMRQTSPVLHILLLALLSACIARGQGKPAADTLEHAIYTYVLVWERPGTETVASCRVFRSDAPGVWAPSGSSRGVS